MEPETCDDGKTTEPRGDKLWVRAGRAVKLSALVACWVMVTVSLLLNQEKTDVTLHAAISSGEIKEYPLQSSEERTKLLVSLMGPFRPSTSTENSLYLWLHRRQESCDGIIEESSAKSMIALQPDGKMDFAQSATETRILLLERKKYGVETAAFVNGTTASSTDECRLFGNGTKVTLRMSTTSNTTVPITLSYQWNPIDETDGIIYAALLLCTLYILIIFEVTGGRTWPLINCLCFFTAFFSTFLDNVTTILLMTPVTIRLCEVMLLNPVPVLMAMVIFSNLGGAATPVGDPPNVIIASQPSVLKENINFATFTLHMALGILLVSVQTYLQLRYMFRDMSKLRHSTPIDLQELRQETAVWRRTAASLSSYSRDEEIVRKALEKKVEKMNAAIKKREAGDQVSKSDPKFSSTLANMKQKYRIRDKQLLIKSAVCVLFVVTIFFLHALPQLERLSLGWTALLGALLLLLLSERVDLEPVLARVEWSTLLFFASLFVMMEALTKLGLISWIGRVTESLITKVNEESRLAVAIVLVLWVSGLASAFVDNIPLTTMMVRVTSGLADPRGLGLPLAPLTWALSFGACLGGNGTLIGASANVVCAGVAEQHGYKITFLNYLRVGFPIMIGNLLVATAYLLFCHCAVTWH